MGAARCVCSEERRSRRGWLASVASVFLLVVAGAADCGGKALGFVLLPSTGRRLGLVHRHAAGGLIVVARPRMDPQPMVDTFEAPSARDAECCTRRLHIATFNVLAPCYRRMASRGVRRESEREDVWMPRARATANFIREDLQGADIVCLQEFWTDTQYMNVFLETLGDTYTFHIHARPNGKQDGLAVLLSKSSGLRVRSQRGVTLCTYGSRGALLLRLEDETCAGLCVHLVNTHLSFPHNIIDRTNQRRQVAEVSKLLDEEVHTAAEGTALLQVICGDFNTEMDDPVCGHLTTRGFHSCYYEQPPPQQQQSTETSTGGGSTREQSTEQMMHQREQQQQEQQLQQQEEEGGGESEEASSLRIQQISAAPTPLTSSYTTPYTPNTHVHTPSQPLLSAATTTTKRFVSHRNHLKQELGVDHIFVRSTTGRASPPSPSSTTTTTTTTTTSPLTTTTATATPPSSSAPPSRAWRDLLGWGGRGGATRTHTHTSSQANFSGDRPSPLRVDVVDAYVVPRDQAVDQWLHGFEERISDHRPVAATLQLTRQPVV